MADRKNIKVSEEIHAKLLEEKLGRESWDQFLLRIVGEESLPQGAYEEATLSFKDILDEQAGLGVDLLVEVQTGSDGWTIDVKRVEDTGYNVSDREGRAKIAEALSKMGTENQVPLYLGQQNEKFSVRPQLTWREDDLGNPIVVDVELNDPDRKN